MQYIKVLCLKSLTCQKSMGIEKHWSQTARLGNADNSEPSELFKILSKYFYDTLFVISSLTYDLSLSLSMILRDETVMICKTIDCDCVCLADIWELLIYTFSPSLYVFLHWLLREETEMLECDRSRIYI